MGNPDGLRRGEIRDIPTGLGAKIGATGMAMDQKCESIAFIEMIARFWSRMSGENTFSADGFQTTGSRDFG